MILIRNGKLFTMAQEGFVDGGDILLDGGKIVSVGRNLSADGAKVIDANGRYVMPGIVDAHCHIGMWEDGMGSEGADGNEVTDPITPQLRAIDAINPADHCFEEAYQHGVTLAATGPGSANVIGGQFVAMKTYGRNMDDMVVKTPLAMKSAFGENPKRCYGGKGRMPETRMGTAAVMREALFAAKDYMEKMDGPEDKRPTFDMRKDALAKVLRRELPIKMHAHRADDILTAIRIAKEFNLDFTIDHCTEGYLIADELKRAGAKCILGPMLTDRSKIELKNMSFKAPAILHKAGVKIALMTDHPVIPMHFLAVQAAICAREGLPEEEALKMITINAAEILGMDDRFGSLAAGKDADLAIYDAHPLDARAHVTHTLVNGEVVYER
ncbi:MAG: amidohydrolase [Clostridiales bacterium]|nr:amidohydrolase [Clostridiales bacterium]